MQSSDGSSCSEGKLTDVESFTMDKFSKVTSVPAYLSIVNVDTDMMIPKQF